MYYHSSKSAFRKSSPKRFYDVQEAPGATHALNPLTKQAHDRDRVPDFYTQTSRVTAQPPSFVCDDAKAQSASKANSTFHKSRANSFAP